MKPTVGRIVHYTSLGDKDGKYPPQVQAAIITGIYKRVPMFGSLHAVDSPPMDYALERVNDGVGLPQDDVSTVVDLKVFYKTGLFDCEKIPMRETSDQRGCWDWPPRGVSFVEPK